MKQVYKAFFLLAFLLLNSGTSFSQSRVQSSVKIDYEGGLPPYVKLSQRINDNLILMYTEPVRGKSAYVGYNENLKQVFRIDADEVMRSPLVQMSARNFYPTFGYNKEADQILIVEMYYQKGGYDFRAKLYDTAGQLVKRESIFLEMKHDNFKRIAIAENGKYFAVFENAGRKQQDLIVHLYDFSLQKLSRNEIKAAEKETFEASTITSKGNTVLFSSTAKDGLEFKRYDTTGKLTETIKSKKQLTGKQKYDKYLLEVSGERVVVATEKKFENALVSIDVFDLDFNAGQVKTYHSMEFTADNVASIFSKVNEDHILNKNYSLTSSKYNKPKHLEGIKLRHLLLEGDQVLVVSEGMQYTTTSKGRSVYYVGDILVTSFTASQNDWNSIIGRRMACSDARLGGWSNILSSVNLHNGKLQVVTCEYLMGSWDDVSTYHRTVDIRTGTVSAPKRMVGQSSWTNNAFTTWLTPDQIILFRTFTNKLTRDFILELVKIEQTHP